MEGKAIGDTDTSEYNNGTKIKEDDNWDEFQRDAFASGVMMLVMAALPCLLCVCCHRYLQLAKDATKSRGARFKVRCGDDDINIEHALRYDEPLRLSLVDDDDADIVYTHCRRCTIVYT